MLKIIVTGPESCGKTTLCTQLAKHFKSKIISEYARNFITNLTRNYNQSDLLKIAKGQLSAENINGNILFCDTDLITIKIWSLFKYKTCNNWIVHQIEKQKKEDRFYLLCRPDIPCQSDSQRENQNNIEELFKLYKKELTELDHDYFIVEGENRRENAISKISQIITTI